MIKKKPIKVKHESLRIRQAQHRNRAEQARYEHVKKFINQERERRNGDLERARKKVQKVIKETLQFIPVPARTLCEFHDRQHLRCNDVALHVVYCYLLKQERNKEVWANLNNEKGAKAMSTDRPVKTPEHLDFIAKAFPGALTTSVPEGWQHPPDLVDIYSHGRAGHDIKCMSTRATPVGGYPTRGPLNFRMWDPDKPVKMIDPTPRRQKAKRQQGRISKASTFVDELEPVALPVADVLTLDGSRQN